MASPRSVTVRVGQSEGDIIGRTQVALQAAVDYVANLGGGVVEIGPGEYLMEDSLHLRTGVTVRGCGEQTVLKKAPGVVAALVTDGDYGEEQITVDNPAGFKVGGGVTVGFERPGNFHTTVATIIAQVDDNTFRINKPLLDDYVMARRALAQTTFPVISGYHIENARVEHLVIDGNGAQNPYLGGCRGGGILLYRAHGTHLVGITVREYHGDGISYQQSNDVVVEDCTVLHCAGHGFHPGSGSQRPVIRRCRALHNGLAGIFLCWRVRFGRFEENESRHNKVAGISIGHKDSDNLFQGNIIAENGQYGVLFREEVEPLAGHRNRFEGNRIVDNGGPEKGYGFYIGGETRDIVITSNIIADTRQGPQRTQRYGIFVGPKAGPVHIDGNEFAGHTEQDVHFAGSQGYAAAAQ